MTTAPQMPVTVRMYKVQEVFGVSSDTVLRWEKKNLINVMRRGRITAVRTEDVLSVLNSSCGAERGAG